MGNVDNGSACKIVQDLLPLYHDGVCSDESCVFVEEHLKACDVCSKMLKALDNNEAGMAYTSNSQILKNGLVAKGRNNYHTYRHMDIRRKSNRVGQNNEFRSAYRNSDSVFDCWSLVDSGRDNQTQREREKMNNWSQESKRESMGTVLHWLSYIATHFRVKRGLPPTSLPQA